MMINSAPSDTLQQKLLVSVAHTAWWSFVVTSVGAFGLSVVVGTPAFFVDVFLSLEITTSLALVGALGIVSLFVATLVRPELPRTTTPRTTVRRGFSAPVLRKTE